MIMLFLRTVYLDVGLCSHDLSFRRSCYCFLMSQCVFFLSLSLSLFTCLWAVTHMIHILQYIGPQFLCAIRPSLGEQWTPDMEEAWTLLLGYMTATMKKSLLEARNAANSPKPVAQPSNDPMAPSSSSSTPAAADDGIID